MDRHSSEAMRLHRVHCSGCSECRPERDIGQRCAHLSDPTDCWECFLPGSVGPSDMHAFGPGEDYEGR